MNERQRAQLEAYAKEASDFTEHWQISRWIKRVASFLTETFGQDESDRFKQLGILNDNYDAFAMKLGHIDGIIAKDENQSAPGKPGISEQGGTETEQIVSGTREVFVVHGHDDEAKESVARFLEKLGLHAIILHEQPNQGRTLIEKFEVSSKNVAFAVVLLTPDDLGCAAGKSDQLESRARQNVILELGYFMGRLGRTRVCALYKGGVDLPSDFQGVVYIELDPAGAWRTKLAQELLGAKITFNHEGLLK